MLDRLSSLLRRIYRTVSSRVTRVFYPPSRRARRLAVLALGFRAFRPAGVFATPGPGWVRLRRWTLWFRMRYGTTVDRLRMGTDGIRSDWLMRAEPPALLLRHRRLVRWPVELGCLPTRRFGGSSLVRSILLVGPLVGRLRRRSPVYRLPGRRPRRFRPGSGRPVIRVRWIRWTVVDWPLVCGSLVVRNRPGTLILRIPTHRLRLLGLRPLWLWLLGLRLLWLRLCWRFGVGRARLAMICRLVGSLGCACLGRVCGLLRLLRLRLLGLRPLWLWLLGLRLLWLRLCWRFGVGRARLAMICRLVGRFGCVGLGRACGLLCK